MKYLVLVAFLFFFTATSIAQRGNDDGYLLYNVEQGETLYSISKRYSVEQRELLNLNPELVNGLKAGMQLRIPVSQNENIEPIVPAPTIQKLPSFTTYEVKRNNTLHFIAQQFDIEVEDILKYNPEAENGIRRGQVLRIPDKDDLEEIKAGGTLGNEAEEPLVIHKVVGDETLYGISRQYGVSISALLAANPEARSRLPIGMELIIPSAEDMPEQESNDVVEGEYFTYLVESGDTYWSLEKKYNTTQAELESLNPALSDGLLAGLRIKIPTYNLPEVQSVPVHENAFINYEVQKGETLYNISKRYNIKISELRRVNPALQMRGLMAGEIIFVPKIVNQNQNPAMAEVQGNDAIPESVPETNFSLENTNSTSNQITAGNQYTTEVMQQDENMDGNVSENPIDYSVEVYSDNIPVMCTPDPLAASGYYQVGLLLPLYLNANDTVNRIRITPEELMEDTAFMNSIDDMSEIPVDTFRWREEEIIYPGSESFLNFYEGILLAVDSLQRAGMHIQLNVFDTNHDKQVVDSLIQLDTFRDLDLIIGPVYPDIQASVSSFAYKNRIPMVSPLSSSGNFEESNPYYFKANPTKEYLVKTTADYIKDEYYDANLNVLKVGDYTNLPEAELVNMCREKFFNTGYSNQSDKLLFHEYDLESDGSLGLSRIVYKDQKNIFIIPSATEAQVSQGINNLNTLAENYPLTLIGLSNFKNYSSIQVEYFHHVNMTLLSPYFIDYKSKVTNRFIEAYRDNYSAEPDQYSFQGYDVAFYFMSALYNYGRDFIDCLPNLQVDLTQTDFSFDRVTRMGGYMNTGLFIVNYTPDYDVVKKGIIGTQNQVYTADN